MEKNSCRVSVLQMVMKKEIYKVETYGLSILGYKPGRVVKINEHVSKYTMFLLVFFLVACRSDVV